MARLELATSSLEERRSVQLSYMGKSCHWQVASRGFSLPPLLRHYGEIFSQLGAFFLGQYVFDTEQLGEFEGFLGWFHGATERTRTSTIWDH